MTIYSLDLLLFQFGTSLLFHVQFFLTVASWLAYRFLRMQVRWSGIPIFFKNFPQFVVIHAVKGFRIVNKAALENPMDGGAWLALSLGSQRIGHDWATSLSLKNPPQNSQGKGFGGLLGWWTLGDLGRVVHSERMWKLFSYPLLEVSFIWLLLNSILL